jgi:hypothetical protein
MESRRVQRSTARGGARRVIAGENVIALRAELPVKQPGMGQRGAVDAGAVTGDETACFFISLRFQQPGGQLNR